MELTFKGRTVTCGTHTWKTEYRILEARQFEDCVCLVLDYMAVPRNLRGYTVDGTPLWIAEHPTKEPADCYTGFLDKDALPALPNVKYFVAYNFASFQCWIDLESGKLLKKSFTK
jgi:hypothetical protein